MYGESFKSDSHRDSSRRRTRHPRGRREQEGVEGVGGWRTPAPWRTFLKTFRNAAAIVGREEPTKETSARSKRVVRTKLRPSGKWNAGELEKFKCARLWRRLRKSPLFSFAPSPPPTKPLPPFPPSPPPPSDDEFRARVVMILNRANLHSRLQNQTSRIHYNPGGLNAKRSTSIVTIKQRSLFFFHSLRSFSEWRASKYKLGKKLYSCFH